MSDRAPEARFDVEALAEGFEQLHLATGSLARAVGPSASSANDWIVACSARPATPHAPRHPNGPSSRIPRTIRVPTPMSARVPAALSVKTSRTPRALSPAFAGRVLRSETDCVEPTPRIDICTGPGSGVYHSFTEFNAAVGPLEGRLAVCHGFPTEGEARTYCKAAACPYPEDQ